ncbi:ABC transporter permease [Roseibium album]|uniref:Putrescine transport system permease protein PotH n=1 Tax=Roseibium album TaxID=311410 RepID=A0A0M6ZM92_9HYPH|nr:ABC transporter permease [Roseibium album]MBG6147085.1 spermidine/putrescine transport system permease protein [Labrenzia sp. EL_142]MBG6159828.1 spermidine/putrescine transport system permease protein [Labrenzia sp. EL_162]MBG6165720.1 spermidine/putrescine transport system permease protein [Labrenzia sp. EL_195]MBG6198360.1 spermidine/putrescine transport system permease protein [Labrenzia sp. EL_159]MBG6201980.1 spermidine/putrescine transport system permease protein [Labrenzia sp. EL_13
MTAHWFSVAIWRVSIWAFLLMAVLIPIAAFLVYGFFGVEGGSIVHALSLDNYVEVASDPVYRKVLGKTLRIAVEVSILCFVTGYIVAVFINRQRPALKYTLIFAVAIPLMMSYVIKIYSMRGLLGHTGFLNQFLIWIGLIDEPLSVFLFNLTAVRMTLVFALVPFSILTTFVGLERIPDATINAARDLGAGPIRIFWTIVLPLSFPSAVVGVMFTFVLSVGDFLAPELVGGVNGLTYGRLIFSQFGIAFNWPLGAALSLVLMVLSFAVIAVAGKLSNPRWLRREGP